MDSTLIQRAKDTDLLALAERCTTLKKVTTSNGGEYAGPCPICGGRDRFHMQPEAGRWLCRHCTDGKWNDAIALQMRLTNQTFPQAVEVLAGDISAEIKSAPARRPAAAERDDGAGAPPSAEWQGQARAVIASAEAELWGAGGGRARAWLNARGLADETIRAAHLGLIPETRREPAADWGLTDKDIYLARGILIPCQVHGVIWYLKIRQPIGEPKYIQARGGRPALYGAESLAGQTAVVFCEGEFDTLLLWQQVGDLAGVVTLGSATNKLNVATWGLYLLPVARRLIAYDLDAAGQRGAAALAWLGNARRLKVPELGEGGKDLTDYHKAGGDLRAWLEECIGFVQSCPENAKRGTSGAFSDEPGHRCPSPAPEGAQSQNDETAPSWAALQEAPADRARELDFITAAIREGWPFYDDTGADLGVAGWLKWGNVGKEVQWQNSPSLSSAG